MFPAIADIAGNKSRCRSSYLQKFMALVRIIKARKPVVRYWIFKGTSREERRAVLRMLRMPVQRRIAGPSSDLLLKRGAVSTKGRHIAVDFVDAEPVHYPIRQAPRDVHWSARCGRAWPKLFVVKSKQLCKASSRVAKLFHSKRWHRLRYLW